MWYFAVNVELLVTYVMGAAVLAFIAWIAYMVGYEHGWDDGAEFDRTLEHADRVLNGEREVDQ